MRYDPALHIVLHEPEIPPNAGNVGRTCVAIGAKMWLVKPLGFKLDDYYLRRAGLDYWDHLEWEAVDSWDHQLAALAAVGRQPPRFRGSPDPQVVRVADKVGRARRPARP